MRLADQMLIDRGLLLVLLKQVEPFDVLSDVTVHNLVFVCALGMFDQGVRGFHCEFFRYAYGAFSKDLDNDLLFLRKKERVENFSLTEKGEQAVEFMQEAGRANDTNRLTLEILQSVLATYAPQDTTALTRAIEAIEVSTPDRPELKWPLQAISFHTTLLVPSRIEVKGAFGIPAALVPRLASAVGS